MVDIFKTIVQLNVQAAFIVLAVIILRLILRKAPRSLICALWALVAIRLMIPFRIESVLSLIPRTETIYHIPGDSEVRTITQAFPGADSTYTVRTAPDMTAGETLGYSFAQIAALIWIIGVCAMLIYAIVSYVRLYRLTRESVKTEDHYLCDRIQSPFILGLFRPKIILPFELDEADKPYVLAHERAHIRRRDHLWKPLGFLLLSVYWFNPLLWVAYILLCRDIESACDEKVIKELGFEVKKPYANALINTAAPRKLINACPVAFGETSVKSRIKNVLNYKKPAFWVIVVTVVLSIIVAVCFLTNPVKTEGTGSSTSDEIGVEYLWSSYDKEASTDDANGYVLARITNDSDRSIIIDQINLKLYKDDKLLTLKTEGDPMLNEFLLAHSSKAASFYLYGNLNDFDNYSTYRLEADYYDGYEIDNTDQKPSGTITIVFTFTDNAESGDLPNTVFDILYNDIDSDGKDEMIVLSPGPTSGISSYDIGVYDKDTHKEKYLHHTLTNRYQAELNIQDGKPMLKCTDLDALSTSVNFSYYAISVKDGKVVLSDDVLENGESLEPIDVVNKFFQLNYDNFPHEAGMKWADVKDLYYGGTYMDGGTQVILLTDTYMIEDCESVGNNVKFQKCEYSHSLLEEFLDFFNQKLADLKDKNEGYCDSVVEFTLLDNIDRIEVGIYDRTEDKITWFKKNFGLDSNEDEIDEMKYVIFKNVTTKPGEDSSESTTGTDTGIEPEIIFTNGMEVYINTDKGIIIYDFENEAYLAKLSSAYLKSSGYEEYYAAVSASGVKIYLYDLKDESKCGVYDMTKGNITTYYDRDPADDDTLFTFDTVEDSFDHFTIIQRKNGITYTLSEPDGNLESLELTVKEADGTEKTCKIFG